MDQSAQKKYVAVPRGECEYLYNGSSSYMYSTVCTVLFRQYVNVSRFNAKI